MRGLTVVTVLCVVALALLAPKPASASSQTGYGLYGDRWWNVIADVRNPLDGKTYVVTGGASYGSVPHNATYWNNLQASNSNGLSIHHYTRVGSLSRYDRGGGYFRYFNDEIRSGYQPANTGAAYSYLQWWNPTYGYYVDYVYITPLNTWSFCDGTADCTDHTIGYVSRSVQNRHWYKVRPGQ